MADNLKLYNQFREVPKDAQKTITGGRLNGKTDINPMWRIKALTEAFGACGFGWWYEITDKHLERTELGEVAAFVDIALYYVIDGQTSKPVYGTGGSAFIAKEKAGLYVSDECYKMALTDAISVACKALGIGADVYWNKDATKYTNRATGLTDGQNQDVSELKPERTEEDSAAIADAVDKIKIEILQIAQAAGRDEKAVSAFAEKLVLDNFKTAVKYKDMNLGYLVTVKNALVKRIDAENAK